MNLTLKKLLYIITAMLAALALVAACSKEPEKKAGKKTKKPPVVSKTENIPLDGKNIFTAARNGQYVTLNWHIDQAGLAGAKIKQIEIMRSLTDTGRNKLTKVAELEPGAVSCQDCLPDEYAYWYSLRLAMEDGKYRLIGPVRVDIDKAGSADYIKPGENYKISITRTDEFATLKWEFPAGEYKTIKIVRSTRPVAGIFSGSGQGNNVLTTKEGKSQYTNPLPDPNAEYWYMFRIILKSGQVIDKGPFRAEYARK